jgi:hypothetical protein
VCQPGEGGGLDLIRRQPGPRGRGDVQSRPERAQAGHERAVEGAAAADQQFHRAGRVAMQRLERRPCREFQQGGLHVDRSRRGRPQCAF